VGSGRYRSLFRSGTCLSVDGERESNREIQVISRWKLRPFNAKIFTVISVLIRAVVCFRLC
jgi:hypothetical protein